MTKQVSLAENTYARLRRHRRPGESFSRTIDRLIESAEKDPWSFVESPKSKLGADAWIRQIEKDRDDATVDA